MTKEQALPKPSTLVERELSPETLATIKAIVKEDQTVQSATAADATDPLRIPGRARREKPSPRWRRKSKRVDRATSPKVRVRRKGRSAPRNWSTLTAWITPRRLALLATIATFLINPWFLPTVLLLIVIVVTFVALLLGPDRIRHYGEIGWTRFEKRKPKKAAAMRKRMNARMERWQKRLDKLPESWTRGLHLPHVQNNEAAQVPAENAYAQRMSQIARDNTRQSFS
ncbi:MAG: hypothetical protein VX444_00185 [Pseudomonadota bacterium]|nr:hypothetical protein [Pseudomonadota bacterium]